MSRRSRGLLRILAAILILSATQSETGQTQPPPGGGPPGHAAATLDNSESHDPFSEYVPGEILVKLAALPSRNAIDRAARSVGARAVKSFTSIGVELWKLESGMPVGLAIAQLARAEHRGAIAFAEPNWISRLHALPDDPRLAELWGLHNVGQTGGTPDADIDAAEAWAVETGEASVVIAVLDTGIDYLHEDLAANVWQNGAETENGLDDDGNGYVDDVVGWDFVGDDNDPLDDHGHGTHTSGTIGAVGGNAIGVSGVNQTVKIMPLKVCSAGGYCTTDDEIEAVLYAASFEDGFGNKIVRVSNNSYGGGRKSRTFEAAIRDSGALFVASAGNSGSSRKQYPAAYALDNVISVAATNHADELAGFSNYGSSWVDLAAPGVDVLSTVPGDDYALASGTSMAAPHVTGVVGLLLAQDSSSENPAIKNAILSSVDLLPSLSDRVLSGGRLNAARALGGSGQPSDTTRPHQVTDLAVEEPATTHDSMTLTWTAPADSDDEGNVKTAYLYDVRYATAPIIETNWEAAMQTDGEPAPQPSGNAETFTVSGLSPLTTYYFALKTLDDAGNVSLLSNGAAGTTGEAPLSAWTISAIDGDSSLGGYDGLALSPDGTPTVAYSDYLNSDVRFGLWNGSGWSTEVVDGRQYAGIDLLYGRDGLPTVTYGWGKLYAATRVGNSWERTTIQNSAYNDVTSLAAVPGGDLAVSYRASGRGEGLNFAERVEGTWLTQLVDPGAGARYTALTYDHDGHPAIAYSDDPDDDGWLNAVALARWTGSAWTTEILEEGPVGYGVPTAITFEAGSANPLVMHQGTRLLEYDGTSWQATVLDPEGIDSATGALAVHAGTTYATWSADGVLKLATRLADGSWQTETVDERGVQGIDTPPRFSTGPNETRIYLVYSGTTPEGHDEVRVASRALD